MWHGFFMEYRLAKGSGAPSALDGLIELLRTYPGKRPIATLDKIDDEWRRVARMKRWFGADPGKKYAQAFIALDKEVSDERERLSSSAGPSRADIERRMHLYRDAMMHTKTESEYFKDITGAFQTILLDPRFRTYMDEELGWLSSTSWLKWSMRTVAPAMLTGWTAKDLQAQLSEMALRACKIRKPYLEQYLLELSIYCSAIGERADIGVIVSQASTVFGPLVGTLLSLPGEGVIGAVASGGRALATRVGNTVGQRKAVPLEETAYAMAGSSAKANLMRFTHAWLKYVTTETPDAARQDAVNIIFSEFGGKRGCRGLYDLLFPL